MNEATASTPAPVPPRPPADADPNDVLEAATSRAFAEAARLYKLDLAEAGAKAKAAPPENPPKA